MMSKPIPVKCLQHNVISIKNNIWIDPHEIIKSQFISFLIQLIRNDAMLTIKPRFVFTVQPYMKDMLSASLSNIHRMLKEHTIMIINIE